MRYLYIIALLLLTSCANLAGTNEECLSSECRLDKLTTYCSSHGGLKEFSNIDDEHYYAICNDSTYIIIAYGESTSFVLDLENFK